MKLYLTLALVALLFSASSAKNLAKTNAKTASEDVVSQEATLDSEDDNNVVDNGNSGVNNENSLPESTLGNQPFVDTAVTHPKVASVNVVNQPLSTKTAANPVHVPSVSVQSVPTANVVKSRTPVKNVEVMKTASVVPHTTSKTVVVNQPAQVVPQHQVVYTQPQQYLTVYEQPQQVVSMQQPQHVPQQQYVYTQVPQQYLTVYEQPQQQYVYTQVPQQVVSMQQPQQVVSVEQPQKSVVSVQQQVPQQYLSVEPQQLVVLKKENHVRTPVQYVSKTVAKVPNPLVLQVQPSKTVASRQTVLTGAQLVDESSVVQNQFQQETESNY